jgi:acyl-CoA thioester hydrolase
MAPVKLELPEQFVYSTELPIYISYINYGAHLGNDAVLALLQEARLRFLVAHGYTELNIEGRGIIIADAVVVYRAEAFHGEMMRIDIALADFNRYGFDMFYRMTNQASGAEIVRAKTGIVFFDYTSRRPTPVPAPFRARWGDEQPR